MKRCPDIPLNRFLRIGIEPRGFGFNDQQGALVIVRHPDSAMCGRRFPSRPGLEDPEKFSGWIGRNICLDHRGERRA